MQFHSALTQGLILTHSAQLLQCRTYVFWQILHQLFQRISWTRRDDEVALMQELICLVPLRDIAKRVDADQEKKAVSPPQTGLDLTNGIDRIAWPALHVCFCVGGLKQGRQEVRLIGQGQ